MANVIAQFLSHYEICGLCCSRLPPVHPWVSAVCARQVRVGPAQHPPASLPPHLASCLVVIATPAIDNKQMPVSAVVEQQIIRKKGYTVSPVVSQKLDTQKKKFHLTVSFSSRPDVIDSPVINNEQE